MVFTDEQIEAIKNGSVGNLDTETIDPDLTVSFPTSTKETISEQILKAASEGNISVPKRTALKTTGLFPSSRSETTHLIRALQFLMGNVSDKKP